MAKNTKILLCKALSSIFFLFCSAAITTLHTKLKLMVILNLIIKRLIMFTVKIESFSIMVLSYLFINYSGIRRQSFMLVVKFLNNSKFCTSVTLCPSVRYV